MEAAANWKAMEESKEQRAVNQGNPLMGSQRSKRRRPPPKPINKRDYMNQIQNADSIIDFMKGRGYQ